MQVAVIGIPRTEEQARDLMLVLRALHEADSCGDVFLGAPLGAAAGPLKLEQAVERLSSFSPQKYPILHRIVRTANGLMAAKHAASASGRRRPNVVFSFSAEECLAFAAAGPALPQLLTVWGFQDLSRVAAASPFNRLKFEAIATPTLLDKVLGRKALRLASGIRTTDTDTWRQLTVLYPLACREKPWLHSPAPVQASLPIGPVTSRAPAGAIDRLTSTDIRTPHSASSEDESARCLASFGSQIIDFARSLVDEASCQ